MVRVSTLAGAAGFAVLASCLSVVSPTRGSVLDLSGATKVAWSPSDDDPSTFNLYLLNKDKIPSVNLKIASNLTTSDEEYTFDGVDVLPGQVSFAFSPAAYSSGYIFNLKDFSSNNILAQSDEFSVVAQGEDTVTSSATATATATSSSSGTGSSTDAPTGAAVRGAGIPVAGGVMGVVVFGVMCAL
ncbi:hypothetical protein BJX99DRAFT_262674 [Aspergillus californicus]